MFTDPPRNIAEAMQQGYDERMVRERMNAPMNGSSRGPIGIGNLGGWAMASGMVFAVETFCPAADGVSAARIEEEVVLTPTGAQIITLFPAKELPIANRY